MAELTMDDWLNKYFDEEHQDFINFYFDFILKNEHTHLTISDIETNYKNIIRKSQPLIVLTNKVYKKLEKKSLDEILRGNLPLNYFINRSLQNVIYDFYENKRNHSIEIVKYYIDNFSSDFITSS